MVPLPVREARERIVSQEALLAADHETPLDEAVTCSDPDAPSAGTLAVEGLSVIDPNALSVSAIEEGNPRACRSSELKVDVLKAVSSSVRLMRYVPDGLNCGTVRSNWNTGLVAVPPVTGRLWRPTTVVHVTRFTHFLPLPNQPLSNPLQHTPH